VAAAAAAAADDGECEAGPHAPPLSSRAHQQHTAALVAGTAATPEQRLCTGVISAPSNNVRRVALGLEVTSAVEAALMLPQGYLQPAVAGDTQLPLLLLVHVQPGE
jgi:hypothetical protein